MPVLADIRGYDVAESIEQVLSRFELVRAAVITDRRLLYIFQAAAACEWSPGYNRWDDYDRFKAQVSAIVGWDGDNPALRASRYYEVCVIAIDYLLPEEPQLVDVTPPPLTEGVPA